MQKGEEKKIELTAKALAKLQTTDFRFHSMPAEDVVKHFSSSTKTGLNNAQVQAAADQYGANELEKEEETSLWEKIKEQFEDLLARILLLAATISFVIALSGDGEEGIAAYVEPFVILLILVLNAMVAIYQDNDADSALEALKDMQATSCTTLRNGTWSSMDSKNLVPGDIVKVVAGDCVPADIRITQLESVSLQVEEAPLTGESVSVQKQTEALTSGGEVLQDQRNMLFSSTIVNYGSGVGVVTFTGMRTAIGRVQEEVRAAAEEEEDTPLKQKLDDFGEKLSYLIGAVCLIVWVMNYKNFFDEIHGSPIKGCIHYFKIAIALAVAAIPEGLPAVITTCLALGTRKMAQNNAIVRRLPSVETLGCTSVICSDKTGTLTKNQMCAVKFGVCEGQAFAQYDVEENKNSYSPENCKIGSNFDGEFKKTQELFTLFAHGCAVNNNSRVVKQEDGEYQRFGEPTEAALRVLASKMIKDNETVCHKKYKTIVQLDFESNRKCMSTVVNDGSKNVQFIKGAPERLLEKCTKYFDKSANTAVDMTTKQRSTFLGLIEKQAAQGQRCLALAYVPDAGKLSKVTPENKDTVLKGVTQRQYADYEGDATFLGFVAIKDPVRPEVKPAIEQCRTAGIRVIMITGDAKSTAIAVAKELNILEQHQNENECCFTGVEFAALDDKKRKEILGSEGGRVFSRVEPRHKRELVKCLMEMGQVVAMTGDGVNDAPALKQAHIGVAMGITGTEVAKFASDMVLADDNFATIVKAVEEGRSIYSNMKAFIRYLISSNIGEVLSIFFTAMLGIPEGFSSVQLLWVNLVTDGPPATALGFNPPDFDIMTKPPRRQDDTLLSGWVLVRYTVIGFYVGAATVGIFIYWYLFAVSGDGHTLISWYQLSHWGQCPTWSAAEFAPANFIEGIDLAKNPCQYFTAGKVKASTLSLSVLVVIEMLNALNAISEDNSLLVMTIFINPYLLLAIAGSIGLHVMIVYVPFMNTIFGIAPLNLYEWGLVLAFSAPVIFIDEILKIMGRAMNEAELKERLGRAQKAKKDK